MLELLEARDLVPSEEQTRRILQETDAARVQVWFKRALKAESVADVLADDAS